MKKLLFVVNVDWFFWSHRLPIALAAKDSGYDVHLACKFTDKYAELKSLGFSLHNISINRSGTALSGEVKTFFAIRELIRVLKPDLVHAVTIKPVLYVGLATRFSKVCFVASISGLGYVFISNGLKAGLFRSAISFFYKLALNRPKAKVIFQNPSDKLLFESSGIIRPEQSVLIKGSGVDLSMYPVSMEPSDTVVVMLLARLLVDKGVIEFVEAAKIIAASGIRYRMVLVGDIDENPKSVKREDLESWVREGFVEYWGFSENVAETYSKANLVVLPSYREGLPKSLIEAAACARAVITTDVPGCRDAIIPGVTGKLVPVKDAASLANAIISLGNDNIARLNMGIAGRVLAESEFDINLVVQKHIRIYSELTGSKNNE